MGSQWASRLATHATVYESEGPPCDYEQDYVLTEQRIFMTKWEYQVIVGRPYHNGESRMQNQLNNLGQEGWEVVGVGHGESSQSAGLTVVLKRQC